jgi:hypothetical protein
MFLFQAPPDTSSYMVAGYAVAFGVMFLYVISLFVRSRNLNRDISTLEEMDENRNNANE